MTETTAPTFRVINITEHRNVVTGLSLDFAHATLKRMQETYKDSRYTLGPDIPSDKPQPAVEKCGECHGHGYVFGEPTKLCLTCLGAGLVVVGP